MIKIDCLEKIYRQMINKGIKSCPIKLHFNNVNFDIIFDISTRPFQLLFGVVDKNLAFSFPVERGFLIRNPYLERHTYKKLMEILNLKYDPNNHFSIKGFLKTFNEKSTYKLNIIEASYLDKIHVYVDVEEADKKFFLKWKSYYCGQHVSLKNLEKTRLLLGEDIYQICKERNISTCWTMIKDQAREPSLASLEEV